MKKMLINATQSVEVRIAIIKGKQLYDLDIENTYYKKKKSNIYIGKISRIVPSLEAVFIDYGSDKHGFLPFKDIAQEYLRDTITHTKLINKFSFKNKNIIVQINKEERANKGASLTTFISLAGIYLILLPNNPHIYGISKKISGNARNILKQKLSLLSIPNGMGIIIRTSSIGKDLKTLNLDLQCRLKHWEIIKHTANKKISPFLIYQESNIIIRALRDYLTPDIQEILIDNIKILQTAKNYINILGHKDFYDKIKFYKGPIPLFSYYQIESQIETAFQRKVRLFSGGSIVIDSTEALTSIDVNSSQATKGADIEETAFNINLEAVDEIAKQLRFRDIGGLIVIDFIDMSLITHQLTIKKRLQAKTKKDRAKIQINHISRFGLLEMSRQRLHSSLKDSSYYICPRCGGNGFLRNNKSLSLSILRLIEEQSFKNQTQEIYVTVPIKIANYLLKEQKQVIYAIQKRNIKISIVPDTKLYTPNYYIMRKKKQINKKNIHLKIKKILYNIVVMYNKILCFIKQCFK
ncbi:Rne/Rng family ribonuclease [Enterobacteriaceae endosymbiont of Macroplea mutica]|uniref:Rne/Rng family ribonuclease n=1 Tax=Enterobacteriaceae endosymbiont of Macroplea mutica TaxID=2675791 RepID=UPI001448E3D5|nr:Rne/Rng family ribonuclease [Enterobacteriaceae endosymbiont of Macroplea mutica]QJC31116.1 Rne/Rng family ribonuclease [Enterobacteriaceae endosymbiont of Macroplea mutica]